MSFSISQIIDRYLSLPDLRERWAAVFETLGGIADDFWKDGNWEKSDQVAAPKPVKNRRESKAPKPDPRVLNPFGNSDALKAGDIWHALPGEVSERMWGRDNVTPADDYMTDRLVGPLGLHKNMAILDLSAGLGSRLRKISDEYGVYITGLEPDPEIALRGMALSHAAGQGKHAVIEHYEPMNLTAQRKHDCVIARETIYRVPDQQHFVAAIVACCKPKAQFSFTDYIVNSEHASDPHIKAWQIAEPGAHPMTLIGMAELWAKNGVDLRSHDDLTEYYKSEVKIGMARFATFMASGIKPDAETKATIAKRVTIWAHRISAIDHGMKFYRFYGIK